MTPERLTRIKLVLAMRQPDLTIITDHVHKGRNLSAIVRTGDSAGVMKVHAIVPPGEAYRPYLGTAKGSHQWVEMQRETSLTSCVSGLKEQGFQVVAADLNESACDYREVDYTRPTALLLGAERLGVSEEGKNLADRSVVIPMMGMVASLNVSVAAAVILAEAQRQRFLAGLYNESRIDEVEYQRLFFRWCHPRLAAFCDRREIVYPAVDDDGEILSTEQWRELVQQGTDRFQSK
ncbi:MAG: tRNA (guanosine(18)-2'-O)-methyltransferase TrmH [Pseudomonadales bacterium]